MVCDNCNTEFPSSFEYAISINKCPKCGNKIMPGEKLEAYKALKKDLSNIKMTMDPNETIDRIVMHLINNYSIRPVLSRKEDAEDFSEELDEDIRTKPKEGVRPKVKSIGKRKRVSVEGGESEGEEENITEEEIEYIEGELVDRDDDVEYANKLLKKQKSSKGNKFLNVGPKTVNRIGE